MQSHLLRVRRMFAAFACLLSTVAVAAGDDKPDAERIVGVWVLESSEKKNDLFEGDGITTRLTFAGERLEFAVLKDGGKVLQIAGSYFLDDKQTPKLFDLTLTGDGGSNSVYALYEFQGEKLRIRVRDDNGPRPADFTTPAADCNTLTFRRDDAAKP